MSVASIGVPAAAPTAGDLAALSPRVVCGSISGTGLAIFLLMVVVGIALRAAQAGWIPLDPGWFYALLGLQIIGIITAMAIAGLGSFGTSSIAKRRSTPGSPTSPMRSLWPVSSVSSSPSFRESTARFGRCSIRCLSSARIGRVRGNRCVAGRQYAGYDRFRHLVHAGARRVARALRWATRRSLVSTTSFVSRSSPSSAASRRRRRRCSPPRLPRSMESYLKQSRHGVRRGDDRPLARCIRTDQPSVGKESPLSVRPHVRESQGRSTSRLQVCTSA